MIIYAKIKKKSTLKRKRGLESYFNLDTMNKTGKRILTAADIAKSYGGRLLFKDSSFYINRGEKIGILGPNGCGKTTLVKIILGWQERIYTCRT